MLFNSFDFLILVLVTFSLYYFKPLQRFQVLIAIGASLTFYAANRLDLLWVLLLSAPNRPRLIHVLVAMRK